MFEGTTKNVYVQKKFTFIAIGYIFYCSFEDLGALEGTTKFADLQILSRKSFHQLSMIHHGSDRNSACIVRLLSVYCA